MKANFLALGLLGLASASAVLPRDEYEPYPEKKEYKSYPDKEYDPYPEKKEYKSYPEKKEYDPYPEKKEYKSYPEKKEYKSYPEKKEYDPYPEKKEYKSYPEKKEYDPYPEKKEYKSYPEKKEYDPYPVKKEYDAYPEKKDYKSYPQKDYKRPEKYPSKPDDYDYLDDGYSYKNKKGSTSSWKPKSKSPEFFNLRVDEKCDIINGVPQDPSLCPFDGYAIRLEGGIFIATPYSKWYDPKLPTFFVDDDTQLYTVSKDPLQVYIDGITGALKYTKIGWLPANAIAISFYHTGNNPLGLVDPSPSYLSWPSTQGGSFFGYPWVLCPLGSTLQFQVFVNNDNFGIGGPAGVAKDACVSRNLAAVNANPWKEESPAPYYPGGPGGYPGPPY